jgi:hypothetical protein
MNGIKTLKSHGRCPTCGRFVKRGLWNMIKHTEVCPERELLLIGRNISKIVKYKDYERLKKS